MKLLNSVLLLTSSAAAIDVIGVEPNRQHLYQPYTENGQQLWKCLSDPSIILNYDQVNDDFCDCPDGSDEPGTNACPYNEDRPKFYCANEGFIPGYIDHHKLNDGVCDYDICCDGSDEYISGKCPNKCKEIKSQYQGFKEQFSNDLAGALQKRKQIEQDSLEARKKFEMAQKVTVEQLKIQKSQVEDLKQQLNDAIIVEESQHGKEQVKSNSILELIEEDLEKLKTDIKWQSGMVEYNSNSFQQLLLMLMNLADNYNPNFNDPAVKEAVQSYQNFISNYKPGIVYDPLLKLNVIEEKITQFDKELSSSSQSKPQTGNLAPESQNYPAPTFINMLAYYANLFKEKWGVQNLDSKPQVATTTTLSSKAVKDLKLKIGLGEKQLKVKSDEIRMIRESLGTQYGENDILRSFKGNWISNKIGEYVYNLGFFESIFQEGNGNKILIGSYDSFEGNKLYYIKGDRCWNGPPRSATVQLVCGSETEILSVSEAEKCQYLIELSTPAVCKELSEESIQEFFTINHDEL